MKIPVLGIACTKFGELWHQSLSDLLAQAEYEALADAHLVPQDIEMIVTANMGASVWSGQGHLGAVSSDILGIDVPAVRIEAACGSGGAALAAGVMAIMSGAARTVMICGVEKMTDVDPAQITAGLMNACLRDGDAFSGASFVSLFALVSQQYFLQYGIGREQLAKVSVKNHTHALNNPLAHLHKKITIEDVLRSPMIADPLSLLDCSPISDGAACIILGAPGSAAQGVNLIASAQATDTMSLAARPTLTSFAATRKAAKLAYAQAGITPENINVAEVHDAFTMAELIALEDLGFCAPGTAGYTNLTIPVNLSGGLKAKGHPIGATGVAQAVEMVKYLRASSVNCVGLTHNMGGIGTTVAVHIFEKRSLGV